MKWFEPCEKLPTDPRPIIIDCEEGVGEGYYKGREVFRFTRFGVDVNADDVYRWAEMPKSESEEKKHMTYGEIFAEFMSKATVEVADYRPCCEMYDVPNIPGAIVIWPKGGGKIIYIADRD